LERDPCPTAKRRRGLRCQRPALSVRLRLPGLRCLCHSDGITPIVQKQIRGALRGNDGPLHKRST
jgi:hypothetical protein